jgi:hypothetical protein
MEASMKRLVLVMSAALTLAAAGVAQVLIMSAALTLAATGPAHAASGTATGAAAGAVGGAVVGGPVGAVVGGVGGAVVGHSADKHKEETREGYHRCHDRHGHLTWCRNHPDQGR